MGAKAASALAQQAINTASWAHGSSEVSRAEIEHLANAVRQVALAVQELAKHIKEYG